MEGMLVLAVRLGLTLGEGRGGEGRGGEGRGGEGRGGERRGGEGRGGEGRGGEGSGAHLVSCIDHVGNQSKEQ